MPLSANLLPPAPPAPAAAAARSGPVAPTVSEAATASSSLRAEFSLRESSEEAPPSAPIGPPAPERGSPESASSPAGSPPREPSAPVLPAKPSSSSSSEAATPPAAQEVQVQCMARTRIPTAYGPVFLHVYHNNLDGKEHLAIVSDPAQLDTPAAADTDFVPIRSHTLDARWHDGETAQERITRGAYVSRLSGHSALPAPVPLSPAPALADAPLVRIHSECFTGETLGSLRCDCGEQLDAALSLIAHSPGKRGIVLYLRQEGRGIGLLEKVRAYNLQDLGMDTVQANLALGRGEDERTYGVAAAMLRDLGVGSAGIRLLTNNPSKVHAMRKEGIEVPERVPMVPRDWQLRDAASHTHALPLTAPQTPDPAALGESGWDARSKGATIVGGGIVRSEELERYLRTKVERMGHMLDLPAAKRV
ncbi:hypothetical protein CALVIDRAFT_510227 [Calocera viscosa TUFC12733]|uniref:GTP cyclohydrolase II n=1 Tax=Calocera viscosa (strain TUFC12733) TaxID=1330018 RepID=A0A167QS40_CALVF|nr:hypothetical protein CALVIDRAFT_510227 [Calocera viscosa TUFC12733]